MFLPERRFIGCSHQKYFPKNLNKVVRDTIDSGLKINFKKPTYNPKKFLNQLGFQLNFQDAKLPIFPPKGEKHKKGAGKICEEGETSVLQSGHLV